MPPTRRPGAHPDAQTLEQLGQSPAIGRLRKAPAADPVLGLAAATAVNTPTVAPPSAEKPQKGTLAPRAASAAKSKVGFYQDPNDTARARAAYDWTRPHEGHRSFSDFISAALMREVGRLERKYHDGSPWPAVAPGQLPTGKPMRPS